MDRKDRLKKILGAAHYALGGMAEDAQSQMSDMDMGEDDFLYDEADDTIDDQSAARKRKARLFALMMDQMPSKNRD